MTRVCPNKIRLQKGAFLICLVSFLLTTDLVLAQPGKGVNPQERCPVCGMFVAKYPDWITQVRLDNGAVKFFDGVKDMMAFVLSPASFGVPGQTPKEIWVKDYYTLAWLDGRSAWYVIGSDVHGPMGHEFIPFASSAAAENFRKDHKGTRVVPFAGITEPLVQSLRHGQKMR